MYLRSPGSSLDHSRPPLPFGGANRPSMAESTATPATSSARDAAAGSWTTAYSRLGSHSPKAVKWGDYLTCRAHEPSNDTWIAAGYTLEGGEERTDIVPRIVHFALAT
jgi:hypothetical protein